MMGSDWVNFGLVLVLINLVAKRRNRHNWLISAVFFILYAIFCRLKAVV